VSGPPNPDVRRDLPARFKKRFGIPLEYIGGRSSGFSKVSIFKPRPHPNAGRLFVNPVPRTYVRGFGALPFGEVRNIHPRTHVRSVLWFGVNWLASKEGLEAYARGQLNPTTRADIDESFLPPHVIIPKPGVDYFEFDWDFILKHKKRVIARMGELLR